MAWFHPERYHKVLTYSRHLREPGLAAGSRRRRAAPGNITTTILPKAAKKPIRIWMEVGEKDNRFDNARRDLAQLAAGQQPHGGGAEEKGL